MEALAGIDRLLGGDLRAQDFMSIFVGVMEGRRLRYVRAGEQYPLHLEAATGNLSRLQAPGHAIGFAPADFEMAGPVELATGDVLLLYTDGVPDAIDRDGRKLEDRGLREALRDLRDRSAREIVDGILERLAPGQKDDLTLVAVKAV